ncbi:HAD family hydrolase [Actinomadura alba]|uniref:Haloacid dehalogenase-like hydrolase n=1 Tax=Actinomadura alba TaxID=406431 RepID=A0ABR7LJY4_9ACTN|nr:haloacid dehalogenase-like hydrolase [Actinomadura alba]MBC6464894.1 haloacid dehalogenase-like hydrolase [Actinomadura alba]
MPPIQRLVLWNIDHTLVDVGRVTREAYADAFRRVTGRQLVTLAPTAGRSESEIIFETLAFNDVITDDDHLPKFIAALGDAFRARYRDVRAHGRVLPGAREALAASARLPGAVQSVLTGSIRPNAILKLTELRLDQYVDFEIGGYGSESYPKSALIGLARSRAAEKYVEKRFGLPIGEPVTVLIADSARDVQAAQIARVKVIAVATGTANEAALRSAGADLVLPTLADTQTVIRAIDHFTSPSAT